MALLVQPGKYCAIITTDTEKEKIMLSRSHKKHINFRITQQ